MRRLRIACIGLKGLPAAGGGARAGEAVIRRLADRYDFTVFSMASHATETEPYAGVRQIILPNPASHKINLAWYYSAAALRAVAAHSFDLVHVHHGIGGYIVPLLRTRFPVLLTCHGYAPGIAKDARLGQWGIRLAAFGEKVGVHAANEVVTVARTHVPHYQRLRNRPVHWIPNGVDFIETGPTPAQNAPKGYIAFAAARIIPIKGLHLVLEAMRQLRLDLPIYVVGELPADSAYARQIKELTAGMDVRFTGLIRDRSELLSLVRHARLFVFPSLTEAMSNMLLEAVSCAAPMVCSDIPENRSILEDDEAVFFESGSAADLARRMAWALDHEAELHRRAARGQQRTSADYSWDRIAGQYASLYEKLGSIRLPSS